MSYLIFKAFNQSCCLLFLAGIVFLEGTGAVLKEDSLPLIKLIGVY
jgi:hypothetical protein